MSAMTTATSTACVECGAPFVVSAEEQARRADWWSDTGQQAGNALAGHLVLEGWVAWRTYESSDLTPTCPKCTKRIEDERTAVIPHPRWCDRDACWGFSLEEANIIHARNWYLDGQLAASLRECVRGEEVIFRAIETEGIEQVNAGDVRRLIDVLAEFAANIQQWDLAPIDS